MHDESIVAEFTRQAESFNTASAATDGQLLDAIVELAAPAAGERWLEAACGPGILARRLATRAGTVTGFDLTPAMLDVARREAGSAGLSNVEFAHGDATALPVADGGFDGAIARFVLHHIPLPGRLVQELARVVVAGGPVVLADHLADADPRAAACSQEIERLRDPSHWACLTLEHLHELARAAGCRIERELIVPLELGFDDWLRRGGGDDRARELVERAAAHVPAGAECFQIRERGGARTLRLQVWVARLVTAVSGNVRSSRG